MAQHRVIIARRALNDLDDIWTYVATQASPRIASDVIEEILAAIERLCDMPGMGHTRKDLPRQYRAWRVFRFLVIYRFDARRLYVLRVVHGHRNIRRIATEE